MVWVWNDGGRAEAGYKGDTRDCVVRAIAIAARLPYQTVYDMVSEYAVRERPRKHTKRSHARTGVHKRTWKRMLVDMGWVWTPTMHIGSGCRVHLLKEELPAGRLIVSVSRHLVAVIDGVIHDTHDPSREGTRCVYGFYRQENT